MQNEYNAILSCCKFLHLDIESLSNAFSTDLDYIYILGQLLYNRVGGVAYYVLGEMKQLEKLNREFRNTLKSIYHTNITMCNSFYKALYILGSVLSMVDFPYALLKGSFLSGLYLPGMRTSNDIDILINFRDITHITKLLSENGFIQGYLKNDVFIPATRTQIIASQMNRGETVPFVKEVNFEFMKYLEIDLNISLDFKPERDQSIVEKLLENTIAGIQTINGRLNTLATDDFLIHLCTHLYKEATVYNWVEFGRDQGLYKYLDIYLLLNKFGNIINFEKINELGLQKECYYAFNGVSKLFGVNISLDDLRVSDMSFLNTITDVSARKMYRYDMDFVDWIFCANRKNELYEIPYNHS
ncbi:hypothetical protein FACS1894105_03830 [Clostridia bacterium]|nr:hypothetical protein FACS1894105_03830 [Clostridia bacterium]